METEVLIVGAGPVGLSLAIELGLQGRRCILVERNDRVGYAPRAKTTNVRTRELFRRWGIAERLAAQSPFGVDAPSHVVFATRLAGGHELARFKNVSYCEPTRDERFNEHGQWIPQYKVEQVLRERVEEIDGVQLHFNTQLRAFSVEADGPVRAVLRQQVAGEAAHEFQVRARYLVGADGARSTVREQLGIRMEGVSPLSHHVNIIFRAPGLAQRHALGHANMYWLINPEVPSVASPMDSDDRWAFGSARLDDAKADPAALIRTGLGLPDLELEVLSRDEWTAHQLLARSYRQGPVFLAGDACHLHPPFGGYGMNMGIGDALDLGWKLGATLAGWGGPALLDSYEVERRQVHQRVIDEAVLNHSVISSQLSTAGIEDAGPEGEAIRARVGARILETKRREFDSLGVVLGSRYRSSPVLPPEAAGGGPDCDATAFVPELRAGCLAPHLWLAEGKAHGASLYDHFAPVGLTLLVTRAGQAEAVQHLREAARAEGLPLTVLTPDPARLAALYPQGLVLVRPDQFVAWSGDTVAGDAAARAVLTLASGRAATAAA